MSHSNLCVGIDLGTTNSVLATINVKPNGDIVSKVVDIPRAVDMYNTVSNETKLSTAKKPTLPSCVYYREENGYEPLVGDFAKIQYPLRPHLVAKSIKSQMGNPLAEGLVDKVPDKTPAEISARILKHMLKSASNIYRTEISDAVITVPANFDSAMCKATRDAAELAGIKITNTDGSERPILLSEPNAVIYDLINQIQNGEISSHILNLDEKRLVMVFDIGGGTLDITMHEISRRDSKGNALKVNEIATNRYTRLGGDDFDEKIAEAMYNRYLKQYEKYPTVVSKLTKEKNVVMPQLRVYAENLKFDLNERCSSDYSSGWDDDDDDIEINIGGNMGGIGYSYDDTFTKEEVEEIVEPFMAKELVFDDFKELDKVKNNYNIIYPILDVLYKASQKLGTSNFKIDGVIVNGGMSKFYLIKERLTDFFGFEPIVALDPDQAVARGAAVYHHYLHQYDEIKDDMKMLGNTEHVDGTLVTTGETKEIKETKQVSRTNAGVKTTPVVTPKALAPNRKYILFGNTILNDSLYLGAKNGAVHEIIKTGTELPYNSEVMKGFRIEPGQRLVVIPIQSRNLDGTYRTIANGKITFNNNYPEGAYVAFKIRMGSNKVISLTAWTCKDIDGKQVMEQGSAVIDINHKEEVSAKSKVIAPHGTSLNAKNEIDTLVQVCRNFEAAKGNKKKELTQRLRDLQTQICSAPNKKDFAEPVLNKLQGAGGYELKQRLYIIARKCAPHWTSTQREALAKICVTQLQPSMAGLDIRGLQLNVNTQAILTLSCCGNEQQLEKLTGLADTNNNITARLYAHGKTCTCVDWVLEQLTKDCEQACDGFKNYLQQSSLAVALMFKKDANGKSSIDDVELKNAVAETLLDTFKRAKLRSVEVTHLLITFAWLCDNRYNSSNIEEPIENEIRAVANNIDSRFGSDVANETQGAVNILNKLIDGGTLTVAEEDFLLTKIDI